MTQADIIVKGFALIGLFLLVEVHSTSRATDGWIRIKEPSTPLLEQRRCCCRSLYRLGLFEVRTWVAHASTGRAEHFVGC